MAQRVSSTTTDHETIRRWVEERGGWPAEVEGTGRAGETGIIRIDFPGFSGEGKLRRISWDDWLEKFDASGLAFVHEETTAGGERSNFNKLVARETAAARARGDRTSRRSGASRTRTGGAGRGAAARRSSGGTARGAKAAPKRSGGRRQASRAEAARTTSRRGGKAAKGTRGGRARSAAPRAGGARKTAGRKGGARGGKARSR